MSWLAAALIAALLVGCDRSDNATKTSSAQSAPHAQTAADAGTGGDCPAFHGGGPLVGVAPPIGAPPMHLRWTYRADADDAASATQPSTQSATAPSSFESAAAIVGGIAYAADRGGGLRAIDMKSGRRKWVYRAEAGFSAGPAVRNGVVFIGDEDGIFHAVRADSGHKLWSFDAGAPIHSSANLLGDKVIFGTDGAEIFCLNCADGAKVWDAKAGDRINGAPAISAPPNKPASVYVSGCDAQLRILSADSGKEQFARDIGALCPGSPALLADRLVLGTDGGRVLCLSLDGHNSLWAFEGVENQAMVYGSPAVDNGIVVVGARDRNLYALDLATGQKKWVFPTRGDVDSSPVISSGRVYVGSRDKHLYVLDLMTGNKLWQFVASRAILATPAIAEGALVIGDTAGQLYCLEPENGP